MQAFFNMLGQLRWPGVTRSSRAKMVVDLDPSETDGLVLDASECPAANNARVGVKLGDFFLGQDTGKNGTKDFGVVDGAGNTVASFASWQTFKRIAVLGDSAAAQSGAFQEAWPSKLERLINQRGGSCEVRDFSINGTTFFRMLNQNDFQTKTALAKVLAYLPDVVIVSGGQNDAVNQADGRNSALQVADATAVFAALRAGLPSAVIIYAAEQGFDSTNFPTPGITLKNKGAFPGNMTLPAAGILTGSWTTEMLETDIGAVTRGRYADWVTLDTAIRALATVNGSITLPFWKAARLGLLSSDNTHMTNVGQTFITMGAFKGLRTLPVFTGLFPTLSDQIMANWQDPDTLFSAYLAASGDGWATAYPGDAFTDAAVTQAFGRRSIFPGAEWVYPRKTRIAHNTLTPALNPGQSGVFCVNVFGAKPYTVMELSIGGGAFGPTPNSTDGDGFVQGFLDLITIGLPPAVYDFRWRIGNEVFGPFAITVGATGKIAGSQGIAVASAATIALTSNRTHITGVTGITRITSTGWLPGSRITLITDGALVLTHGTAAAGADLGMKLVGSANVNMTANDQIQLELDSDGFWYQVAPVVAI